MTRHIDEIIVHCTATRSDWWSKKTAQEKVNEVRRWHTGRGWSDVGYHYLIDRDGTIVKGRPVERAGAHVKGHNANSIGISLFGGHGASATDVFQDHFTLAQDAALRELIVSLCNDFPSIKKISGHNEYSNKGCPGFKVGSWMGDRPERTSPTQSKTMRASATAIGGAAGTAATAIGALDDVAQYIVLGFTGVIILAALFIMRERLRKWADGDR